MEKHFSDISDLRSSAAELMGRAEIALLASRSEIRKLNDNYEKAISLLFDLDKTMTAYFYEEGIRRLCLVYEKFLLIDDFDFKDSLTEELGYILQNHFQAVAFAPSPGDDFDPKEHERRDWNQTGDRITSCSMPGWKLGDKVLVKAYVETE